MNRKLSLPALAVAFGIGITGCDLEVTNPNDADRERALASAGDVETLIASSFVSGYWEVAQDFRSWAASMEVMSNHGSSAWGNAGMNDTGREPREPMQNQTSYSYSYIFEVPWQDAYLGISGATEGIRAIDPEFGGTLEIGSGGADNPRALAFAKFVQGISHCSLGMGFDKAFLIDESVDITQPIQSVPYAEVIAFGLTKLDAALAIAQANQFTLPDTWMNGNSLTSTEFAALIRGYKARCRANQPRDPSERGDVNWSAVADDAANSIGDFLVVMTESQPWDADMKQLGCGSERATWCRMHYDFSGQGDVAGGYQEWLAIPVAQRHPDKVTDFIIPDQRWPQNKVDGETGPFTSAIYPDGYYEYNSNCCIGRAERGTYRFSEFSSAHYRAYVDNDFGPVPEMLRTEMDLLRAEAALEMGDIATAVSLINQTRVGHGGLPAVVDASTVPGGAQCVPRKRFDPAGTCGDLRDALQWEHYNEIFSLSAGLTFWFERRQGELPPGTPIHYPIPAIELEVLQEDLYTFGGSGEGSAGPPVLNTLDATLMRVTRILELFEERRAAAAAAENARVLR